MRRAGSPMRWACWLCLVLCACAAASGGQSSEPAAVVTVLAHGRQCLPAPATWAATWIASPEELRRFVERCQSHRIGFIPAPPPVVDFASAGVLAVEMGHQPTAGHGFDAGQVALRVDGQTAVVTLTVHRPAPDAFTAQVITAPWILLQMPAGRFRTIQVVDPTGRLLVRTAVDD